MYVDNNMIPTVQIINASTTYVSPAQCKYIKTYIIGAGGGGAGGTVASPGGGGGAGKVILQLFPAGTYTVVVGNAGTGGAAGLAGTAGTTTTFNAVSANGGGAGQLGAGSSTGGNISSTGTIRLGSLPGTAGQDNPITSNETSGCGGVNMFSVNGNANMRLSADRSGFIGSGFGSGGGGGQGATGAGGNGTKGAVIVIEYY